MPNSYNPTVDLTGLETDVAAVLVDTGATLPATLSALDGKVDTVDGVVDAILVDTDATLPATLSTIDGKIDTVDGVVDAVLVDTGATLPATLSTMEGKIDTVDGVVDAVLVDTGTTLPTSFTNVQTLIVTLDGKVVAVDGIVDAILVDTGTTIPATIATVDGNVDTLATRLSAARAGYLDNLLRVSPTVMTKTVNGLVTVSAFSWTDILGWEVTLPTISGKTFTVVATFIGALTGGGVLSIRFVGNTFGDGDTIVGLWGVNVYHTVVIAQAGCVSGEIIHLESNITANTCLLQALFLEVIQEN